MNRFALTLILAAAPLLAAGLLAQSENVSLDSSTNVSSALANSASAKQLFRGHWLDGSSFTQDSSFSANEFFSVSKSYAAYQPVELAGGHRVSTVNGMRAQRSEQTSRPGDSLIPNPEDQLAKFNALYESLTHGSLGSSSEVSLSVYHQLMDQQFATRTNIGASARTHFTFQSSANIEKKSPAISAAELEAVRITAQRTEHAADIRDVTAARMKKAMQQRVYSQRPNIPQRNRLSGESAPARAEQNRVLAVAMMERAFAGAKVFGGFTERENSSRTSHPEVFTVIGDDNSSGETAPVSERKLKSRSGEPIK